LVADSKRKRLEKEKINYPNALMGLTNSIGIETRIENVRNIKKKRKTEHR